MSDTANQIRADLSYWRWFARTGVGKLFDRWILLHAAIGYGLARLVAGDLQTVASGALLPLASILIGLAFAWAGNALVVLQTPELRRIAMHAEAPGYSSYLFTFQMAILVVLATLVAWGLLAVGVGHTLARIAPEAKMVGRSVAFAVTSLAIRECWHVVLGTQSLLIMRHAVQREQEKAAPTCACPCCFCQASRKDDR